MNRIEREFLDVLAWQLGVTQVDILAHYGAIVNLDSSPQKQPSVTPPPTTTTTTTPPVHYTPPKDTSTPIRNSTASYDLSSPPTLLYPATLAAQPFLKAEEARNSRPSTFPGFHRPWHGKNHSMHGQHTLQRISV